MSEQFIISDPAVMMGKPVVAGTRVTVELPRRVSEALDLPGAENSYAVMAYDNSVTECRAVKAEVLFLRKRFKGHDCWIIPYQKRINDR